MRVRWLAALLLGAAALLGLFAYTLGGSSAPVPVTAGLSVTAALGGDGGGFAQALEPRPFRFPEDHGPHPAFRNEWWYFTGNLEAPEGRPFGFQLTFFRTRLTPEAPERPSRWAADQVYMAHLAVTDVAAGRFAAFEAFRREALGLAGARGAPFRVWLDAWEARGTGESATPMRLAAVREGTGAELTLEPLKPLVLQGEAGLSRKGPGTGDASYYYSWTRLAARGRIWAAGRAYPVEGLAWMDREWSTSALGEDQEGWDWFALQLSGRRELMVYRLRRRDGSDDRFTSGVLVDSDGSTLRLERDDFEMTVLDRWQSPDSGILYPARWRLEVPDRELDLTVEPLLADQELDLIVRYWEGAVAVRGSWGAEAVTGSGYVELTGYGGAPGRERPGP